MAFYRPSVAFPRSDEDIKPFLRCIQRSMFIRLISIVMMMMMMMMMIMMTTDVALCV